MSNDPNIDFNQIAANIAIESVKQIAASFTQQMKRALQHHQAGNGDLFAAYAENSLCFYRSVRTIIHRSEPVDLISIYGHLRVKRHSATLLDVDFLKIAADHRCCVVTGTAGSGKSFLLRYLFCRMFEMPNAQVPVLIELRRLGDLKGRSVPDLVDASLKAFGLTLEMTVLNELLQGGRFAIFFDGLDELDPKSRRAFEDAIMEFLKVARRNLLVVSSRPDQRFHGWPHFTEYQVQRLTAADAAGMVQKLNIDEGLKTNFLNAIDDGTLSSKSELIGIPLFVYILILVFRDYAQVPTRTVLFYRFAFDVLYSKHDALKVGFERFRYTDLPIDQMERVVGCFCFLSYMNHQFEFGESELAQRVQEAIEVENLAVDAGDLQQDLLECLCLLQRDGMGIVFTHRSFQEYFCAHYLVNSEYVESIEDCLDEVALRIGNQVVQMAHALAEGKVETGWVIPKIETLRAQGYIAGDATLLDACTLEIIVRRGVVSFEWSVPFELFELSLAAATCLHTQLPLLQGDPQLVIGLSSEEFKARAVAYTGAEPLNNQGTGEHRLDWTSDRGSTKFKVEGADVEWLRAVGLLRQVQSYRNAVLTIMAEFEARAQRRAAGLRRVKSLLRKN